jgi:predicted phage terminase large subunit-like protein
MSFSRDDLRWYRDPKDIRGNVYMLVDPASTKNKRSDYTALWVVCLSEDQNYYVLDIVRDRLNLAERWKLLVGLHRLWRPIKTLYEKFGKDSDIEHFKGEMERENYRFELEPAASKDAKVNRIAALGPLFEAHRIYLPDRLERVTRETGDVQDMVRLFVDTEYSCWPYSEHDDMLDCLAQIRWPKAGLVFPQSARDDWWRARGVQARVAVGTGEVVEH